MTVRGLAVVLLLSAASASANSITIGLPALPGNGNCVPFGCPGPPIGTTTYQQVYTSTAFSDPFTIGGIDFFQTELPAGSPAGGTYTIDLSYTSRAVGALSLVDPADNITFGSQPFFSGTLPGLVGGVMAFSGSPFYYDPSLGNLLMTIQISGGINSSPLFFLDWSMSTTQTSRAYFGTITNGNSPGLITEFAEFDAVPEPTGLLLLGSGLLGIVGRLRRKRLAADALR